MPRTGDYPGDDQVVFSENCKTVPTAGTWMFVQRLFAGRYHLEVKGERRFSSLL